MSINIKCIKMLVKRTTYTMVEVSEDNGYDMPLTLEEVISLAEEMKSNPVRFAEDQVHDDEVSIESFKVEEE